jgi:putative membrane protein
MSGFQLQRKSLAVGVLSLGFAVGAIAQGTGSNSAAAPAAPATAAPAAPSSPGALSTTPLEHTKSTVARADHKFAEKAAMGGLAEVELGRLAQQKGASEQVKQFGARMVADHSKANEELKQIASAKGIQVPATLDKKHEKTVDKLQKLSGADFDRHYMKEMVSDHKEDVSEFKKEANSGKDPELKAFAGKTLPVLQEHLKMAQAAHDAVKSK